MNMLTENARREQQHRAELAALEQTAAARTCYVSPAELEQARQQIVLDRANTVALERAEAMRVASEQARIDAITAQREVEQTTIVAGFKAQARQAFPGTQAQFDAAWPTLLATWQRQQTLGLLDAATDAKRRMIAEYL